MVRSAGWTFTAPLVLSVLLFVMGIPYFVPPVLLLLALVLWPARPRAHDRAGAALVFGTFHTLFLISLLWATDPGAGHLTRLVILVPGWVLCVGTAWLAIGDIDIIRARPPLTVLLVRSAGAGALCGVGLLIILALSDGGWPGIVLAFGALAAVIGLVTGPAFALTGVGMAWVARRARA